MEPSAQAEKPQGDLAGLRSDLDKIEHFLNEYETDPAISMIKNLNEFRLESSFEQKMANIDYDAAKSLIRELRNSS